VLAVIAILAAACGSRVSDKDAAAVNGGGSGGAAATTATTATTASGGTATTAAGGTTTAADTSKSACGPGKATGATAPGVTNTTITIATIQDITGPRPGLMLAPQQATQAFVDYCNSLGGVNGRKLVLQKYDSALFDDQKAATQACAGGNFASVGQTSAIDNTGAQVLVDCNLVSVPGFTATAEFGGSELMVQPLPNPPGHYAVGGARYLAQRFPAAVKKATVLYAGIDTTRFQVKRQVAAFEAVGWKYVYQAEYNPVNPDFSPNVVQIKGAGGQVWNLQGEVTDFARMLALFQQQGMNLPIRYGGQQDYTQELIDRAGAAAEGVIIEDTTVPFEEASTSPEMQLYLKWLKKVDASARPTALAVQSWSASLLFATAVKALGSNVTQQGLLDELHKIKVWNGNGIHATADPGDDIPTTCFAYLVVKDAKFQRYFPQKGFSCSPKNVVTLKGDFGQGAARK
jgi:ABC-type branched-subunit amino acid transport system substrate-binding protein